jgi:hypothetical protein
LHRYTSVVWEILADVDDQADFQKETEIFEARQQRSDPKRDQVGLYKLNQVNP